MKFHKKFRERFSTPSVTIPTIPLYGERNFNNISGGHNVAGDMNVERLNIQPDKGKDRALEEQGKNVEYSLVVLREELKKYHDDLKRKDEYIRDVIATSRRKHDELTAELIMHGKKLREWGDGLFYLIENEKMQSPEAIEITLRFKAAIDHMRGLEGHGVMKAFCERNGINYTQFSQTLRRPDKRILPPLWIAYLCLECPEISPDWIMTGRSEMLRK